MTQRIEMQLQMKRKPVLDSLLGDHEWHTVEEVMLALWDIMRPQVIIRRALRSGRRKFQGLDDQMLKGRRNFTVMALTQYHQCHPLEKRYEESGRRRLIAVRLKENLNNPVEEL